jgi:hypothetical protein
MRRHRGPVPVVCALAARTVTLNTATERRYDQIRDGLRKRLRDEPWPVLENISGSLLQLNGMGQR